MEQYELNGSFGVKFTKENYDAVRQWVQDRAEQGEIVATPARLYLPIGTDDMVTVDDNDMIWWNPEGGPNAFRRESM